MNMMNPKTLLAIGFTLASVSFGEPVSFTSQIKNIREMPEYLAGKTFTEFTAQISLRNEPCNALTFYTATASDMGLTPEAFSELLQKRYAQSANGLYFNVQIESCDVENDLVVIKSLEPCNTQNCPDHYVLEDKVWLDQNFAQTMDPSWISYYYHLPLQWDEEKQLWEVKAYYAQDIYFTDIYEDPMPVAFVTYSQSNEPDKVTPYGPFTQYYASGDVMTKKHYGENGAEGESTNYHPSGKVHQTATFKAGKPHGDVITYHENGVVESDILYDEGKPVDRFCTHYFEDGTVSRTHTYYQGSYDGEYVDYYPDGSISLKGQYHQGNMSGIRESFFPSGELEYHHQYMTEAPFAKDGEQRTYYESGQIKREEQYQKGINTSTKDWDKNGTLVRIVSTNLEGQKDGLQQRRNANGQLRNEQTYKNGVMIGDNKEWGDDEVLLLHETYDDEGVPIGEHQYWSNYDHKLSKKKIYGDNGTLLFTEDYQYAFDDSGEHQIIIEDHLQETTTTTFYDALGKVLKVTNH